MTFKNAYEGWTLYDTVMVSSVVDSLYKNSAWYTSYQALGQPSTIPFFNVRNKSVGVQYCNFDSANKLPFVFHCYSIGIDFDAPAVSFGDESETTGQSDAFFAAELANHCGFILKVSQDEKLVQTCVCMPSGQGVAGWNSQVGATGPDPAHSMQNVTFGIPDRENRWHFAKEPGDIPVQMPREVNIEGLLIVSEYGRAALAKMAGPGNWQFNTSASGFNSYPQAATIRVSMYGKREVQQRNDLHFTG